MPERTHGFRIDEQKCRGHLACMRACPTQAIRVTDGKARLLPQFCVDCGICLTACPSGAIGAITQSFAELDKFKYKVAVPSPVLFAQFPVGITPARTILGLKALGFDAVWDFTVELALVNRAILDYVEEWNGPFPVLSISCPVIVRLIQVMYPAMIDQLLRLQPPRELAGRELKRKYSEELGLHPDEIAAVYITPCQAKTISILKPAEGVKSNLDGAIGISDVYNDIVALTKDLEKKETVAPPKGPACSVEMLRWAISKGQGNTLRRHRYMSVTGLSNVIQVFEDIYKGKLRNIEYLECDACWGGCIGGNLTVDNIYVTLSKIHRLWSDLPNTDPRVDAEVERRYPIEDFSLKGEVMPRATGKNTGGLKERVKRIKTEEAVNKMLPGLDCGLCGAPTCKTFANDVAAGHASQDDCVMLSGKRLKALQAMYHRKGEESTPEGGG